MARLRSLTQDPAGGFQVIIPEIGQKKAFVGSYNACKRYVMGVVRGNSFLAKKHGWDRSEEWAGAFVENQNAARMLAKPEYHHYLIMDAEPAPAPVRDIPDGDHSKKNAGVAGGVGSQASQLAVGVSILLDWLGAGGKPVGQSLAEMRAATCAGCPQNGQGDWRKIFTEPIANKIRQQLAMKHEMKLATKADTHLRVCDACACPLQLKVWTPLPHILKYTDAGTKGELDQRCWIIHEEQTPA
jgi:hypothetical protein